jgi:hypothetical protein
MERCNTREHKTFPEVANLSKIQQSESSHRRTEYRQVVFIIVEEVNVVIVPFFEVAMLPCHYLQPFLLSRQKQNSHFYFPAKSKIAISTFPPNGGCFQSLGADAHSHSCLFPEVSSVHYPKAQYYENIILQRRRFTVRNHNTTTTTTTMTTTKTTTVTTTTSPRPASHLGQIII